MLLATALFSGFDTSGYEEIDLGQFLSGIAILRAGTSDELAAFKYQCLCLSHR